LVRLDLRADPRRDRRPGPRPRLPRRAGGGPVPGAPSAPPGCVPVDRLPAPRADRGLGDRQRRPAAAAIARARRRHAGVGIGRDPSGSWWGACVGRVFADDARRTRHQAARSDQPRLHVVVLTPGAPSLPNVITTYEPRAGDASAMIERIVFHRAAAFGPYAK